VEGTLNLDDLIIKWPDLIINIFGVAIGGLLAYGIARWQINIQEKKQNAKDMKLLLRKFEHVCIELRDNRNSIRSLYEILRENGLVVTREQWNYYKAVADSFSLFHFHEIVRTDLVNILPNEIQFELFNSYDHVKTLYHMVHQAANLSFALHSTPSPSVDLTLPLTNLITYTNTTLSHLDYSVDLFYKHKDKNK